MFLFTITNVNLKISLLGFKNKLILNYLIQLCDQSMQKSFKFLWNIDAFSDLNNKIQVEKQKDS